MAVGLVIWLVVRILARDTRSPLNPPLRLVRVDRSHLSFARAR